MAQYRHLPIWKAALDLAVHLEHAVRRFSRYNKYTLGGDLRQTAQRLCRLWRAPTTAPASPARWWDKRGISKPASNVAP